MPVSLIANVRGQSSASFTTSAIDTTGATLLVASLSGFYTVAPAISDSKGNTWTALTVQTYPPNRSNTLYYAVNPTVGSGHTFTSPTTFSSLIVAAFSGIQTSSPFVNSTGAQQAASPIATGSISTTSGDLVISSIGSFATGAFSVSPGTIIDQVQYLAGNYAGNAMAYLLSTGGSYSFSWSGPTGLATTIASFRATSGLSQLATLGAG